MMTPSAWLLSVFGAAGSRDRRKEGMDLSITRVSEDPSLRANSSTSLEGKQCP